LCRSDVVQVIAIYYAEIMRRLITIFVMLLAFPLSAAEVYRSVDAQGNVVFSDQPTDDSEKIELKELPVVPGMQDIPPPVTRPIPVPRYRTVAIINPENDETYFRSQGDLVVAIQIEPRLSGSDTVVLYLNEQEYGSGRTTVFKIPELDRGTHQVRAVIKDANGDIVMNSDPVTFHMRHTSVIQSRP